MMNLGAFSWRNTPWIKATRPQWRYALRNGEYVDAYYMARMK